MAFECRIEADSISPTGDRATTFVITMPRVVLAEFNTHRMLSRNSASSRAIPVEKRIRSVLEDPFVPAAWAANKSGMQAGEPLGDDDSERARSVWLASRDSVVESSRKMAELGIHKQWVNRLLEPFCWTTVVATASRWQNFFALRCHPDAQPEIQTIARMMRDAYEASTPEPLEYGWWHLPFVRPEELSLVCGGGDAVRQRYKRVSVGRCARVSYLTHDGRRDDEADLGLCERLMSSVPLHSSPAEHQLTPARPGESVKGNCPGWHQFRHEFVNESVPG